MRDESNSTANWSVYMIETQQGRLYTGITTDIQRRWQAHLSGRGGAKFFRSDKPRRVVFLESGYNQGDATRREMAIKSLSATEKRRLIDPAAAPLIDKVLADAT